MQHRRHDGDRATGKPTEAQAGMRVVGEVDQVDLGAGQLQAHVHSGREQLPRTVRERQG
ncbi:hypothetical protein GM535_13655, partial [Streptococcus pneumoniae]|nr:hypothetical protein [Streptococcus pneumoniae]